GAGADGVAGEVLVTEALGRLAVDDRGERHGELVEEEWIDRGQIELDAVGRGGADAAHALRLAGDVVLRALDAVEELGALGVDGGSEQALERVFDVRGGHGPAGRERDVVADGEADVAAVGADRPGLGQLGHDVRPRVVVDQGVEDHLLEAPGDRVVALRRIERARVLARGLAEYPTLPRRLVAVRRTRR